MANVNLANLVREVNEVRAVIPSAVALIDGITTRIDAAVAAAIANGATEAELAPLAELSTQLDTDSNALAAAVAAHP